MSQSIRARAALLVFRSTLKITILIEDVEICLPVKFLLIPSSGSRGVVKISQPIRGRRAIFVFRSARQRQTSLRTLRSCFRSSFVKFRSAVSEEKSRIAPPIRGLTAILIFRSAPQKTTNLAEDLEIFLPVKFHWIPLRGFRGEVENEKNLTTTVGCRAADRLQTTHDHKSALEPLAEVH